MINRRSFVLRLPLLYALYFIPKVVRSFEIAAVRIWPSADYTRLAIEHLEEEIKIQYNINVYSIITIHDILEYIEDNSEFSQHKSDVEKYIANFGI